jgi:hypothetical protein
MIVVIEYKNHLKYFLFAVSIALLSLPLSFILLLSSQLNYAIPELLIP